MNGSSTAGSAEWGLARAILEMHGLSPLASLKRLPVGFSFDLYVLNDDYVLKVGRAQKEDLKALQREAFVCGLLQGRLPVARILGSDLFTGRFSRPFILYERIAGHNLYSEWAGYSMRERRETIRQLCQHLRAINAVPAEECESGFGGEMGLVWYERVSGRIFDLLERIKARGLLTAERIDATFRFVKERQAALGPATMALTFYDPHFDNILVQDGEIVALLDFERTGWMSIDYVLDLVRRMVDYPTKYAAPAHHASIRSEHYSSLLDWCREFYPEAFDFPNLNARLNLYSIEHTLDTLYTFEAPALEEILVRYLDGE